MPIQDECRKEFMTRKECLLREENIDLKLAQLRNDLKSFRNQLVFAFGASTTVIVIVIEVFSILMGVKS